MLFGVTLLVGEEPPNPQGSHAASSGRPENVYVTMCVCARVSTIGHGEL